MPRQAQSKYFVKVTWTFKSQPCLTRWFRDTTEVLLNQMGCEELDVKVREQKAKKK